MFYASRDFRLCQATCGDRKNALMKAKIKKDLERGEGTRLAPDAKLFDPADDSHVQPNSPIQLKERELAAKMNDETYRTPD